ncbi:GGDEF domain-containing protein [Paenochrobactrum sp. BZR 588]|uniref:GGDEF domain-containing protein n=1 Tax=unclassified Paenochrobactrum TaxID=2639760 RepID=UPI003853BA53
MIKSTLLKAALVTIAVTALSVLVTWLVGVVLGNPVSITAIVLSAILPIVTAFPSLCILLTKYRQLNEQHNLLEIAHAELQARAKIDHMTGLLNRESLFEAVKIARARIETGAFLMIDADHFKAINDNFGHATGDRALKLIAFAIENVTRKGDLVGRIGGEEFCVFLPNASGDTAKRVADRIRSEVDATHFYSDEDMLYPLTVSIGCTTAPKNESNSQILSRADQALYIAKQRGRNCSVFISETSVDPDKIVTEIRQKSA